MIRVAEINTLQENLYLVMRELPMPRIGKLLIPTKGLWDSSHLAELLLAF